ncbi:MAG TPA: ECF-type sigma factor [Xanthomonadaceae bacterium]|nr:ECF-type sigma factor [Xanthomonadaceae bacterium]
MAAGQPEALTAMLARWNAGDAGAGEQVIASVYAELKRLAGRCLRDSGNLTLQPTALVNEALIRLIGPEPDWDNRAHFFGAAARAMRQVLVDAARRRLADKRGGGAVHVTLGAAEQMGSEADVDLLALEQALARLEALDAQQARIVELRYFVGLSIDETARVLDLHPSAVNREWAMARAWLYRELTR